MAKCCIPQFLRNSVHAVIIESEHCYEKRIKKALEMGGHEVKILPVKSVSIGFDFLLFFSFSTNLQSRKEKPAELAVPQNMDMHYVNLAPAVFQIMLDPGLFRGKSRIINNLNPKAGFPLTNLSVQLENDEYKN